MPLKFTENEKSGVSEGKKGVKRGENDENYHLRKLLFLPKNLEEWWRKSYLCNRNLLVNREKLW